MEWIEIEMDLGCQTPFFSSRVIRLFHHPAESLKFWHNRYRCTPADSLGCEIAAQFITISAVIYPYNLMLTGKGDEVDRIIGLRADDYMVKLFSLKELAAWVVSSHNILGCLSRCFVSNHSNINNFMCKFSCRN